MNPWKKQREIFLKNLAFFVLVKFGITQCNGHIMLTDIKGYVWGLTFLITFLLQSTMLMNDCQLIVLWLDRKLMVKSLMVKGMTISASQHLVMRSRLKGKSLLK